MQSNSRQKNIVSAHESGDFFVVQLTQGKEAWIDKEDIELVQNYKWHFRKDKNNMGYAVHAWYTSPTTNPDSIKMHRLILGLKKGDTTQVDHINLNKLDNRRVNLRLSTQSENGINRPKFRKNTTSIYKGVYLHKWRKHKQWRASIRYKGKLIPCGYHQEERDAGIAYNKKALELFGKFAYINIIQ